MTVRAALVLGLFLVLAALVHGGIWSAGHDFVVHRFTGEFAFVPAEEEGDVDDAAPARRGVNWGRGALTSRKPKDN